MGQFPTVRFGSVHTAGSAPFVDVVLTGIAADTAAGSTKTKITVGTGIDFNTGGNTLKKGTAVYFAPGATATEFYNVLVDEATCVGKMLDGTTGNEIYKDDGTGEGVAGVGATEVEVIPGDGVNCQADSGAGTAPFGRLSALSGYGGTVVVSTDADYEKNQKADAGCETECGEFGCE